MNGAGGSGGEAQAARAVLLVRPARFGFNQETAATNAFQVERVLSPERAQAAAVEELERFASALREAGVEVLLFDDTPEPHTPDALFPNNWLSTHADGSVVLYPMQPRSRRAEVRADVVEALRASFRVSRVLDLRSLEASGSFLEGTGSLVLDRPNRVAYACLSARTTERGLEELSRRLEYAVETFRAVDSQGRAVYHTNVVMCVGSAFALVCLEAIGHYGERARVRARLEAAEHEVVSITRAQMASFAGNALELRGSAGPLLALSTRARSSLTREQVARLERHVHLIDSPLETIEDLGGGSARCLLAEIHLASKR